MQVAEYAEMLVAENAETTVVVIRRSKEKLERHVIKGTGDGSKENSNVLFFYHRFGISFNLILVGHH